MKKVFIVISLQGICYLLLSFIVSLTVNSAANARTKGKIPSPSISSIESLFLSRSQTLIINGTGFIKGLNSANQIFLFPKDIKLKKRSFKRNAIRLNVLNVDENALQASIPTNISYGDYDIYLRLKTRLLKSKLSKLNETIFIRPAAPESPELSHSVISNEFDLDSLLKEPDLELEVIGTGLEVGLNKISSYYFEEGFKSLNSEPVTLYYLPKEDIRNELEVESNIPLQSFALKNEIIGSEDSFKIDVSEVTRNEEKELSKHFFLSTPNNPRYLEHIIRLKPIFIEELHVKADEFVVIQNRSSTDFPLGSCTLSDSIKERFSFTEDEVLTAKSSKKVTANLGLNDTSPDSLSLHCHNELIDQLNYSKIDENGFAIKN